MRILVLAQSYPSLQNPYTMAFVHTRIINYKKLGIKVDVLNFESQINYEFDGIEVLTLQTVNINNYDVYMSHAPNIRNHVKILNSVKNKHIIFFFHGHEVLKTITDYPQPYSWNKLSFPQKATHAIYDHFKLIALKYWFKKMSLKNKLTFVFVSSWMKKQFIKNIGYNPELYGNSAIIHNSVNFNFHEKCYTPRNIKADFITIRPLDPSKYSIDLVVNFAKANPDKSFHIYGKGLFFNHIEKPSNITVMNNFISQNELPELLNQYKCALMPTKYDAQGVMMCEMAEYGIPLISTNIEICREMLANYPNVLLLPTEEFSNPLQSIDHLQQSDFKTDKFSPILLAEMEIELLQ